MSELEKSLSFPTLLLISINSIMGTGIFFLPAIAAAAAGVSSVLSWLAMSVLAILISLVFAELSSMYPSAGGVYEYCKQAFGSFPSFLIGWLTLIVGNVTIAMLVVGAIRYLNPMLPLGLKITFSILFILLFNYMAFRGLQTSAVMLVSFAFITLITILSLTIPGLLSFSPGKFSNLFGAKPSLMLFAVFLVAETFFGWETATFLSEETKDAQRTIPKALIISTVAIAVIVMLFVIASLSTVSAGLLGASAAPLTLLAEVIYGVSAAPLFSILVYVSIIGSVAGWIVSAPRLVMALAKDKLFIESLKKIHPKHKTPYRAIVFQTLLTSLLIVVGSASYETLLELLVPLVLIMYAAVILALIVLRYKAPDVKRYFRMPLGVPLGVLLIACLIGLVGFWAYSSHNAVFLLRIAGSFLLVGIPVYVLLKLTYDPSAVSQSARFSGRFSVWFERFLFPVSVRKRILSMVRLAEKRVLEYGGNVGTLTLHLAEEVGPNGSVVATEYSEPNARILQKRVEKGGHTHVQVIHDAHHLNRVHPDVKQIDVVVSVGYLSFIQDIGKVLRELRERLPDGGMVVFVEYVDYFKVLPNAGWAADPERLQEVFRENGFAVRAQKIKGLFWNYLIIHGIRTDDAVPFV